MASLLEKVRMAVANDRHLFTNHADDMLRERSIMAWQVIAGLAEARQLVERPDARPNPVLEVEVLLADGTPVKAVWAYLSSTGTAKLVTVHFFDA
jgi:hypothetical protein